MKKIKIIIFVLVLGVIVYLGMFMERAPVVVNNPNIWIEDSVALEKIPNSSVWEEEETEFYKITYDLSGIVDENVRPDIERWISDRVTQFKVGSGFESATEEEKDPAGPGRKFKHSIDFSYDLKESEKIQTYVIKSAVFSGGAHGNLEIVTFNYEKDGGRRISLNDIFIKKPSQYLPALSLLGNEFLKLEYGDVAAYEGVKPEPVNWATWYATDTSLVFIFQTYQVVPYAYGIPEMKVSVKDISNLVNLEYFSK